MTVIYYSPFRLVNPLSYGPVPSAVGSPTVTQTAVSGEPALIVSWSRPQSELTIIRYDMQYRVAGSGTAWTLPVIGPNPTPASFSSLFGGTI